MRNLLKLMFQRVFLVSLAILGQLAFFFVTLKFFDDYLNWFSGVMEILAFALVIYIISNDHTKPAYKIAWIVPLLTFPLFGGILYLTFGGNRLSLRQKRKMELTQEGMRRALHQDNAVYGALLAENRHAAAQARYLIRCADCPVYENTETTYLSPGEACFSAMLRELRKAEKYIFLEYFIIEKGTMWSAILEILRQKAAQGVDVRIIYDDFGCITRLPTHYAKKLAKLGIRATAFNPFVPVLSSRLNNRSHRKLMIIDGVVGFTGGINLADEYINKVERFGHWKDSGILLRGDAVYAMTVMFLSFWDGIFRSRSDFSAFLPTRISTVGTGFVQPYCDSPLDFEPVGENVYLNLIAHATRSISIMTPYLIIDDTMCTALTNAAKGGIDVRIITPHIPDKHYVHALTRANYQQLVEAGVRIYEYEPGFLHSKVFCVDDTYATVGSINMDFRSLYLHFENGVWLYRTDCIADIRRDFEQTLRKCIPITLADCRNIALPRRVMRAILRFMAPLL